MAKKSAPSMLCFNIQKKRKIYHTKGIFQGNISISREQTKEHTKEKEKKRKRE